MKKKIIGFIAIFLLLCHCAPLKFAPDYNEALEKQIIETQKLNEKIYTTILSESIEKRVFTTYEKQYLETESEINSIYFQIKNSKKNTDLLVNINKLKEGFNEYKEEHKSKKTLTDGEIKVYIKYIDGFYTPLLLSEKALKNIKK